MTSAEYERIRDVFLRALELPPSERSALVDAECPEELRGALRRMLEAHEQGELVEEKRPDPERTAELPVGQRIGRYRVLERIGEGGMSVVYRAEDVDLQRPVALKFLSPLLSHNPEARERFLREARAAAAIDHPNVCPVYEVNADGARPYLVMALLEGRTAAEAVASGPLATAEAIDIAVQACRGLEAAHAKGIIHRDIKPSNLMLGRAATGSGGRVVKILDFGVARYEREGTLTLAGSTVGTIAYMSPEQIESESVDARSDLWSLGATIYELLAGRPAFDRGSMRELAAAITGAEPRRLSEIRQDIPPGLVRIIERLLRKAPEERIQSASELAVELEEVHRTQTGALRPPAIRSPRPARWRMAAIAAGALLLGAFAYWAVAGRDAAAPTQAAMLEPTPVTTYPGLEYAPALSPDGQSVAFIWDGGESGAADLYVQPVGAFEPLRLTDTPEHEASPTWSPDGDRIAFLRWDGVNRSIHSVPASGGAEELVLSLPGRSGASYLDWSSRGDIMALERDAAVVGIRLSDPQAPPIQYGKEGFNANLPRLGPAGERIAFLERRTKWGERVRRRAGER